LDISLSLFSLIWLHGIILGVLISSCSVFLFHIGVKHIGKNVLGVFESLGHFEVAAFEGSGQGILASVSLLVHVGNESLLRAENNFSLISEVNLNNLVIQSKHNSMLGLEPLFNVDQPKLLAFIIKLTVVILVLEITFKVTSEMLKKSNLLLKFFGIISQSVLVNNLNFIRHLLFNILKVTSLWFKNDLGGIIEEDTRCTI